MVLEKDGITIELVSPVQIARYKAMGFIEVPPRAPAASPAASNVRAAKKGGDKAVQHDA